MKELTQEEMLEVNGGGWFSVRETTGSHVGKAMREALGRVAHDLTERRDRNPKNRDKVRREREHRNRERRGRNA